MIAWTDAASYCLWAPFGMLSPGVLIMASIQGPFGGAQVIGSLASTVFQRGSNGPIIRTRTTPNNPNSANQAAQRAAFAAMSAYWTSDLTATERQAWDDYAAATPLVNRLGNSINVGGRRMFLRTNVTGFRLTGGVVDAAPTTPGVGTPISFTLTGDTVSGISIDSPSPSLPTNDVIIVTQSVPMSQARNYYSSPFSFNQYFLGTATLPLTLIAAANVSIGQRWFFRFRTFENDGKVADFVQQSVDILA